MKIFNNLISSNIKGSLLITLKNNFSEAKMYNNIDLDTEENRWSISIGYISGPLN